MYNTIAREFRAIYSNTRLMQHCSLKLAELKVIVVLSNKDEVGEDGAKHEDVCDAHHEGSKMVDLNRGGTLTQHMWLRWCVCVYVCVHACARTCVCV